MSEASKDSPAAIEPFPPPAVGWYATLLLAFLYWMSLLDRFIIVLMVEPIKQDLGITDTQFGILQGLAFLLSFTVFGFIFGALADRRSRRALIYIGVSIWSLASAACGLANNFWHLLMARAGLGAGEASLNPCATSMISDLFPREKLTSAMAVYSIGATIGGGTALMLGGAIIHFVSVSGLSDLVLPVIGEIKTWQAVFFIVGLSSLPLAFLVFTIPEPVRRGRKKGATPGSWRSVYVIFLKFVKTRLRFFACHYGGFTIAAIAAVGATPWYPVHMMRTFGWGEGRVGFSLGMTILIAGIVGKLLAGWLVDAMYKRGYRDAQLRWYACCLIVAVPLGIIATTSSNPWVFLVLIGMFSILITSLPACAMSALNMVTPNQLRGTGIAVYTTLAGLVGASAGAVLIPMISDAVYEGDGSIGLAIATLIGIVGPLGALLLALGLKPMREAMSEVEDN